MIICPKCGNNRCDTKGSHYAKGQGFIRKRKCFSCGYTFKTIEIADTEYNIIVGLLSSIETIVQQKLDEKAPKTN